MPFTSSDDRLPRRNARSFDLDDSAAKAAAWVWHLHTSKPGVTTEGRFISSQSRRRSSGNYDRKATRFRQEASTTAANAGASGNKTDTQMWDCGSNLYDTFELVAFGNRLDRSLMEAVPITPLQAHPQEHHIKSPLHKPNGILRTLSLPRSLSEQTSKNHTEEARREDEISEQTSKNHTEEARREDEISQQTSKNHTEVASPSALNKFKLSKSDKNGSKGRSLTGSAQIKASTRWSKVGKFMNVIKKMVVLHRQVSLVGCKRSTHVIESSHSQRPLDSISQRKDDVCARGNQLLVHKKIRANLSSSNLRERDCMDDDFPLPHTMVNGGTQGNYKLSIPSKDNGGDLSSMQKKVKALTSSGSFGRRLSSTMSAKFRFSSESVRDELLSEHKKIRPRRKYVEGDLVFMDEEIKGSNLEGVDAKERIRGANEHLDHYKHWHHHHHHHHHHHYLHHNLASESARLSPETMSRICADQSWLV